MTRDTSSDGRAALVALMRDEGPRVLATLVRVTGSLTIAEDAVQDAVVRALEVWPLEGVPPSPRAWLTLVARRRAIDLLRRENARAAKELAAAIPFAHAGPEIAGPEIAGPEVAGPEIADDMLRLIFTCTHPSLSPETQLALTLHIVCGLTTAEVGRALLVSEAAMAKRLTRARRKIAVAGIPYRVPGRDELPQRLQGVLRTTYLVFNEGYSASSGADPLRHSLMAEAIRLGRLLFELLPREVGVRGLLALMLLHQSRSAARGTDAVVLLADQDRTRWDSSSVNEALELLGEVFHAGGSPDSYVAQAAIAACHALAPTFAETNWTAILSWYDVLLRVADTPVVRLNRAVAVAQVSGPAAGLAALETVYGLPDYSLLPAARAELLVQLERHEEAAAAYREALACPVNDAQRRHLEQRLSQSILPRER